MQLPENEENIVEDQPTEAVDSDADDNENQEDFSEEIEDEDTESSLENEDYPLFSIDIFTCFDTFINGSKKFTD